jgi:hypothetical protein
VIGRFLEWLVVDKLARWFPQRYRVVPRITDGAPMIRQFKLTDWAYLQSFRVEDAADLFHVHRWRRMVSLVLSGGFIEERYPGLYFLNHFAPHAYSMDATHIHRIYGVLPRTWTLFMFFGFRNHFASDTGWGYYRRPADTGFSPSDAAIPPEHRVRSL